MLTDCSTNCPQALVALETVSGRQVALRSLTSAAAELTGSCLPATRTGASLQAASDLERTVMLCQAHCSTVARALDVAALAFGDDKGVAPGLMAFALDTAER